jgi:chemotaxis receptor (MCP) glutamine deamidase CheD
MKGRGAVDLVVKLFGCAQVLDVGSYDTGRRTVGEQNEARTEMILFSMGHMVSARDAGGLQGRKLHFCTRDGGVCPHRAGGNK